jgi:hypothetical protein
VARSHRLARSHRWGSAAQQRVERTEPRPATSLPTPARPHPSQATSFAVRSTDWFWINLGEDGGDNLINAGNRLTIARARQFLLGRRAIWHRLRTDTAGRPFTVFKSIGAANQDLSAAVAVYEQARALNIGTQVSSLASLKTF